MIEIIYNSENISAQIKKIDSCESWNHISSLFFTSSTINNQSFIEIPWNNFLNKKKDFQEIVDFFPNDIKFNKTTREILQHSEINLNLFNNPRIETKDIQIKKILSENNFSRNLFWYQMRNVKQLIRRNSSASFSVPGSGKTTEALAFYSYFYDKIDKVLIISPKNAFKAWFDEIESKKGCFANSSHKLKIMRNNEILPINKIFKRETFIILNYEKVSKIKKDIVNLLTNHSTLIIIDESHYIKGHQSKRTIDILSIAHLAKFKLILSGTPIPNKTSEIITQFRFLYPSINLSENEIIKKVQDIYVRTPRNELDIPGLDKKDRVISLQLSETQRRIYNLVSKNSLKNIELYKNEGLARIRKSVMLLLELISNPLLIENYLMVIPDIIKDPSMLNELESPKINYAVNRARELFKNGKKVIIWSYFVKNVDIICERLRDINAVKIHGGIDHQERFDIIDRFNEDPKCGCIVINPAAGSEGISLHQNCHYAIYVDRTFNSVQFLQSKDRIRRIGQKEEPHFEILCHKNTIDERVYDRLNDKIEIMADFLNDSTIKAEHVWTRVEELTSKEDNIEDSCVYEEDLEYIITSLKNE